MSKLNWSLTPILLIVPLAASCSRQSSEPQTMRDDSSKVVTQSVKIDELIAKARQIENLHRTRQQRESEPQQHQVAAVAYGSPEREPSDLRWLLDDQRMEQLHQQLRHAQRRVTGGLRLAATRASSTMTRWRTVAIRAYEEASPAEEPGPSEEPSTEDPTAEDPTAEEAADPVLSEDPEQDAGAAEPLSEDPPTQEPDVEVSPSDAMAAVQKVAPPRATRTIRACLAPRRLLRSPRIVVRPQARRTVLNRCSNPSIRRTPIRNVLRRR